LQYVKNVSGGQDGCELAVQLGGAHPADGVGIHVRTIGVAAVVFALLTADKCLEQLSTDETLWASRLVARDDARRMLGRARTDLEYRPLEDVLTDLSTYMDRVQRICSAASDAVSRRYFPRGRATAWVREIS